MKQAIRDRLRLANGRVVEEGRGDDGESTIYIAEFDDEHLREIVKGLLRGEWPTAGLCVILAPCEELGWQGTEVACYGEGLLDIPLRGRTLGSIWKEAPCPSTS